MSAEPDYDDDELLDYLNCGCTDSGSPWPCFDCDQYLRRQRNSVVVAGAEGEA